jgi:hypothetical protein
LQSYCSIEKFSNQDDNRETWRAGRDLNPRPAGDITRKNHFFFKQHAWRNKTQEGDKLEEKHSSI